jgi:mono/diheme cytochrome c family protein
MRFLLPVLGFALFGGAALAVACSSANDTPAVADAGVDSGAVLPSTAKEDYGLNTTGVGAGTGADTGLPCDVQQLLENYCIGCHLATTKFPLLTYADLMKPAPSDPTKTMAKRSLERLTDSSMPPKPAEPLDADEVAVFKAWVDSGTPKGDGPCTTAPPPAVDAGADAGPSVCTSKTTWKGGDEGDPNMHPGGACITCHTLKGGPAYKVAGTVFPTAHEPNDCNGYPQPLNIVVTDAKGKETTLQTNGVGNFFTRTKIFPPFKVKVVNGAKERAMTGTLTAGDCNSCHTEKGANGAPGRIMAP